MTKTVLGYGKVCGCEFGSSAFALPLATLCNHFHERVSLCFFHVTGYHFMRLSALSVSVWTCCVRHARDCDFGQEECFKSLVLRISNLRSYFLLNIYLPSLSLYDLSSFSSGLPPRLESIEHKARPLARTSWTSTYTLSPIIIRNLPSTCQISSESGIHPRDDNVDADQNHKTIKVDATKKNDIKTSARQVHRQSIENVGRRDRSKGEVQHHPNGSIAWVHPKTGAWVPAVYHNDIRQTLLDRADNHGTFQYTHERAKGLASDDRTAFHAAQRHWGLDRENWPVVDGLDVLHQFERNGHQGAWHGITPDSMFEPDGRIGK